MEFRKVTIAAGAVVLAGALAGGAYELGSGSDHTQPADASGQVAGTTSGQVAGTTSGQGSAVTSGSANHGTASSGSGSGSTTQTTTQPTSSPCVPTKNNYSCLLKNPFVNQIIKKQ